MARISLRDATIRVKDGLAGTAAIDEDSSVPVSTDTTFGINTTVLNTVDTDQVPIGARFTVAGETASDTVHTVTARVPTTGTTTDITFTPMLGAGTYADEGVVTFLPQQLEIKLGDGDLTWTVNREFEYLLDRGLLDTVRSGDEQPMSISIDSVYEHITTGTSELISPYDAFNQLGGALEWVSTSSDACEPYAVDLEVFHSTTCVSSQDELTLFPDFRYDSLDVSLQNATVSITGQCNAVKPTVTRS